LLIGSRQFELPALRFALLFAAAGRPGSALAPLMRARLSRAAALLGIVVVVAVSIALVVVSHCRRPSGVEGSCSHSLRHYVEAICTAATSVPFIGSKSNVEILKGRLNEGIPARVLMASTMTLNFSPAGTL
jgi:hypothetical protein